MREFLISLDRDAKISLQSQIREVLVSAILNGHLKASQRLPSSRHMAKMLGTSRNTVVLAYQALTDDGYLRTAERSGYFVNETVLEGAFIDNKHRLDFSKDTAAGTGTSVDWDARLSKHPTHQRNIYKPKNWLSFDYPFIYGQSDPALFPISDWRDCVYKAMGRKWIDAWSSDTLDRDDEMLVEQIKSRILPRRGILVGSDQILVTMGVQQGLYMIASLLVNHKTRVALEEPGYSDTRNIFRLRTEKISAVDVDDAGLVVDERLDDVDLVCATPSHQFPTTVTMPPERRKALLQRAQERDFLIIEDDYELETNHHDAPLPALKSLDNDGRVIYLGSFSKTLFPGLRLGFMVAPAEFISEVRALRRLMVRHPPTSNQSNTALFLSLGYYDVYLRKLQRIHRQRWQEMGEALSEFMPGFSWPASSGGSAYWVKGPRDLDSDELAKQALEQSIFIEPGSVYFDRGPAPTNFFRLGFSSIAAEKIKPGIEKLAGLIG